jgi:hypothetical protein
MFGFGLIWLACSDSPITGPGDTKVSTVTVSPSSYNAHSIGETIQFTATAQDAEGRELADISFDWEAYDEAVAEVTEQGTATAMGVGRTTITASADGIVGRATLVVDQVATNISLSPQLDTLIFVGDTTRLSGAATDANGHEVPGLSWRSSNELVVHVSEAGLATAVGKGEAVVTVSSGALSESARLIVLGVEDIQDGVPATGLSGDAGSHRFFRFTVPPGSASATRQTANAASGTVLRVTTAGGTGDVSLYIRFGDVPTASGFDCSSGLPANDEVCELPNPAVGHWYVMVRGVEAYASVTLLAQISEIPPSDPSNLSATADGTSAVDLTWQDNSDNETEFRIERRIGSGGWTQIATLAADTESYRDTELSPNTAYTYRVRACNTGGCSDWSNEDSATTDPQHELTVEGAGTGNGAVTSAPAGINCTITAGAAGDDCSELYDEGTQVTLTAAADAGSAFEGWSGGGCSGTGICQVTMSQAQSVTATFILIPAVPTLSASVVGASVELSWTNVSGETEYRLERRVGSGNWSQIATPDANIAGYTDAGLTPGESYSYRIQACNGPACSDWSNVVTEVPGYLLTVNVGGSGNGTITSSPSGIDCSITGGSVSGSCSMTFPVGQLVALEFAAASGSTLFSLAGCTWTGPSSCEVSMTQDSIVSATFSLLRQLQVFGSGDGSGSVTASDGLIDCTITAGSVAGDCTEDYADLAIVTLSAAAGSGSTFGGWSGGGCSGTGTCQVTMDQAWSVTATFELIPIPLITVTSPDGGESWEIGTTHSITWASEHAGASVAIELYKGGSLHSTISDNTSNDGTYSWTIPSNHENGSDFRVRITDLGDGTVYDESDGDFEVFGCTLSSPEDADGDRLPDCAETNTQVFVSELDTGTDPNDPDTDDDAIRDGDEVLGTLAGLDLPLMGVSPLRQDILVEYDWFDDALQCGSHSHRPTAATIAMVTATFANAPVNNPDGSTGINYIHDYGQGGAFTGGNLIADPDGVLSSGVSGSEFLDYKSANFNSNRDGYFHYTMLPHRYNTSSNSSGQAELWGDDLIVSLYCSNSDKNVANTIVHELGHNLDLRHGGFENTNYKPNYNSVMNYKYQFPGIDDDCTPPGDGVLDYSIGVRPPLDENDLDETQGVCGNPPGPGWDWNGDGDALDVGIVVDINAGDGIFKVLADYNDWAFLVLSGISDSDGARLPSEIVSCMNPAPVQRR